MILADTVGFIRHLPHKLVEAFRATLEESSNADLLLHVIDSHEPERDQQIDQVLRVLGEIGADQLPMLEVYNKIDLLEGVEPQIQRDGEGKPQRVWLSAREGKGLDLLRQTIAELLGEDLFVGTCACRSAWGACAHSSSSWGPCRKKPTMNGGPACCRCACRASS